MTRRVYSPEFKREAGQLIVAHGVSVAQASRDLDVHATVLRRWVGEFGSNGPDAFPGKGHLKPVDEELRGMRREVAKLKAERDSLKKGETVFRHWSEANVRTPTLPWTNCDVWVRSEAPRDLAPLGRLLRNRLPGNGVSWMCDALGVSRSGFHAWLTRPQSARVRRDEMLGAVVRASFAQSDRTYGARRVWHDVLVEGFKCGLHGIERLMQLNALRARPRRRQLPKDQGKRSIIAPNVLEREFEADGPNQKWVADFTNIWIAEGWLYVAVVID